jgi:hypothetical protein
MVFRPACSPPTAPRLLVLVLAAVLTTGRRTVTHRLRTVRFPAQGQGSADPRVFSQRRGSPWALACAWITCLLDHVVPPGPVLLAGAETVTEHPGPQGCGKGRHRAGVRSTRSSTASRWGPKWGVMAGRGKLPVATRPWALPSLVAVSRPDRMPGPRQPPPAPMARLGLAPLRRWLPERHFSFVGDRGYGTRETARFCHQHRQHLPVVRKVDGEAAWYAPPPPRPRHTMGRPRVKGQQRAAPQAVGANTAKRTRLTVAW